jgi:RNA-directed DNA polymerase
MNPYGGADDRRVAVKPDPDEHLLEQILSRPNMLKAWERVKANKGAPGIDKMPIDDFMAFAFVYFCRHLSTFAGQEGGDP